MFNRIPNVLKFSKTALFALICLSSVLFANYSYSQDDPKSTKITIFKAEDNPTTKTDDKKKVVLRSNVKWNWSILGRGVFLMNYEFLIKEKLTGEAGLGITYRDFIFEAFSEINGSYDFGGGSNNSGSYALMPNVHVCGEGGIRFYPRGHDNFEGIFLSPMLSYRKYSFQQMKDPAYTNTSPTFQPGYSFFDVQLKLGYQYESLWDWNVLGEIYFGCALRNATINYYEQGLNQSTSQYTYISKTANLKIPQGLFGLKICIPF